MTNAEEEQHTPVERRGMDDLKDRLSRAEQNHINLKENFQEFKSETQAEFKSLSTKIDILITDIGAIKITIARWLGAGLAAIALGEILIKLFLKA